MSRRYPSRGRDYTPSVGADTDVARLGRGPKPFHERTAVEDRNSANWNQIAHDYHYRQLIEKKILFIVPVCVFFVAYYFALPILVGFYPEMMTQPIWGKVNAAYLFALSQFFMAWGLAGLYVYAANRFDIRVEKILDNQRRGGRS